MGSKFSTVAKKEFLQHPDRIWDPPSLLLKGTGTVFRATGFTREVKDVARSGPEHTHPSCQCVPGAPLEKYNGGDMRPTALPSSVTLRNLFIYHA